MDPFSKAINDYMTYGPCHEMLPQLDTLTWVYMVHEKAYYLYHGSNYITYISHGELRHLTKQDVRTFVGSIIRHYFLEQGLG